MGEFFRGFAVQAGVGALRVVVPAPGLGQAHGVAQIFEQMSAEAFIAQLAVEALTQAILLGLSGLYIVPVDAVPLGPAEYGFAGELGAIVADDALGLAYARDNHVELVADALTGQTSVYRKAEALSGVVVYDG